MKFIEKLQTLQNLQDFSVEIQLSSWESLVIENIKWKQASLQLLQNHLDWQDSTSEKFDIEDFCEYYHEWLENPDGHHSTIAFLNKY